MASSKSVNLMTQAAVAEATYTGAEFVEANAKHAVAYLDLTVFTGTNELLDVDIEGKDSVSGKWFVIVSFTQLSAVGKERIVLNPLLDNPIRAKAVVGGTGVAATFTVGITIKDESL